VAAAGSCGADGKVKVGVEGEEGTAERREVLLAGDPLDEGGEGEGDKKGSLPPSALLLLLLLLLRLCR